MPAIAAIDNETLDHLLSVVDDARNLTGVRALSKPGRARPTQGCASRRQGCVSVRRVAGGSMPGRGLATGGQALQASAALRAVRASFFVLSAVPPPTKSLLSRVRVVAAPLPL